MEQIMEAARNIHLVMLSGDPDVVALLITARASCGVRVAGQTNIFCSTQQDIIRAEIRFEQLFKSILRNHCPSSIG